MHASTMILWWAGVLVAFKYRVYPKAWQGRLLKSHLTRLCTLYNTLRDLKIEAWKRRGVSLNENDLRHIALEKRRQDEGLRGIHSQVVQHVATRVYTVFKNSFYDHKYAYNHVSDRSTAVQVMFCVAEIF